jgi:uncharacterized protein YidB (DUF937 family)
MSLWDELGGLAAGALGGNAAQQQPAPDMHSGMLNAVLGMLQNQGTGTVVQPDAPAQVSGGALGGLLQTLEQNGLGHLAASWIGSGQNLPISAEQVENLLGGAQVGQLAQQAGVPQSEASSLIAAILPTLVDRLTPAGTIQHTLLDEGINLLRSRLA